MGRSPSSSPLSSSPPPLPASGPSRRSGRVPKPTPNPEQILASPTAAKPPKPMEQSSTSTASAKPRLKGYDLDYKDKDKGKNKATSDNPTPWRHPDEFPFVNHADWSQDLMMEYLRYHSFTVSPRDSPSSIQLIPILLWGSIPPVTDPVSSESSLAVWLPRGYRVPLMFIAKFQWDSLRIVLNAPDPKADWEAFKFNILHLSRLCQHLFEQAREARRQAIIKVDASQDKAVLKALAKGEKDRAVLGGFDKNWRCPSFDRLLTRFYNKWFLSTDEWLENFFNEFDEEEYHEQDVVKHDWIRWAFKGHKGFLLTKDEVQNGITAEQYMWGLNKVPDGDEGSGKFKWVWDDNRQPPQNAVSGWSIPGSTSDPASAQVKREIIDYAMARDVDHATKSTLTLEKSTLDQFNEITNPPKSLTIPPIRAFKKPPPAAADKEKQAPFKSPRKASASSATRATAPTTTSASASASTTTNAKADNKRSTYAEFKAAVLAKSSSASSTSTANKGGVSRKSVTTAQGRPDKASETAQRTTPSASGVKRKAINIPVARTKASVERERAAAAAAASQSNKDKDSKKENKDQGDEAGRGDKGKQAEVSPKKRKRADVEGEAGSVSDAGRAKRKRQSPTFKLDELPQISIPKKFLHSSGSSKVDKNDSEESPDEEEEDESESEEEEEEEEEEDDTRKDKSYRPQWGGLRNKQNPASLSTTLPPKSQTSGGQESSAASVASALTPSASPSLSHSRSPNPSASASPAPPSATANVNGTGTANVRRTKITARRAIPRTMNVTARNTIMSAIFGNSASNGAPSSALPSYRRASVVTPTNSNSVSTSTPKPATPTISTQSPIPAEAKQDATKLTPNSVGAANAASAPTTGGGSSQPLPPKTITTGNTTYITTKSRKITGVNEATNHNNNSDTEMNEIETTVNAGADDSGDESSSSSFDIASSGQSDDEESSPSVKNVETAQATSTAAIKATDTSVDERMEVDEGGSGSSQPPAPKKKTYSGHGQPQSQPHRPVNSQTPQEGVRELMSQGNRAKSLHTILLLRELLQFLRIPGWGNLREVFERKGRGLVAGSGMAYMPTPPQSEAQKHGQDQGQSQQGLLEDEEVMTVDQRLDILAHASVAMAQVLFPFRGEELSNKIEQLDRRLQQQFDLLWKPEDRPPLRSPESLKKVFEDKEIQTVLVDALTKEIQTMELEAKAPTPEPEPPRSLASQETQTIESVEVHETAVQTEVEEVEPSPLVIETRPQSNSGDVVMVDATAPLPPSPVAGPSTGELPKASTSAIEQATPTAKAMMSIMRNIANLLELEEGAGSTKSAKGKERETNGVEVEGSSDIGGTAVVVEAIVNEFKAMKEELREIQQKTHKEFESLTTIHRSEVESLKNELRNRDDRGKNELEVIQQQHREELEHLRETIRTLVREKEEKKSEMIEGNSIPALQLLELRQRIASLENRSRTDVSEMSTSLVGSPSVSQFSDHRSTTAFHPLGHLLSQDFEDVVPTPSIVASPDTRTFLRDQSTPNPGTPASTSNPFSTSSKQEGADQEESISSASIPFPIKSQRKMHIMGFPRSSVG